MAHTSLAGSMGTQGRDLLQRTPGRHTSGLPQMEGWGDTLFGIPKHGILSMSRDFFFIQAHCPSAVCSLHTSTKPQRSHNSPSAVPAAPTSVLNTVVVWNTIIQRQLVRCQSIVKKTFSIVKWDRKWKRESSGYKQLNGVSLWLLSQIASRVGHNNKGNRSYIIYENLKIIES